MTNDFDNTLGAKAARVEICFVCGQEINLLEDSWSGDAKAKRHTKCPISPEIADLPRADADERFAVQPGGLAYEPAPAAPPARYLRQSEVEQMLGISNSTLMRLIRSGKLPAKRLPGGSAKRPGAVLIREADVHAMLEDVSPGG